jgi:hypothetical protein
MELLGGDPQPQPGARVVGDGVGGFGGELA